MTKINGNQTAKPTGERRVSVDRRAAAGGEMLGSFVQLGKIFTGGKPFSALFKELMENVRQILGAEGGSLYLYDKSSQTLKIVVLTNDILKFEKVVETFDPLRANGFIQIETRNDKGEVDLKNLSVCCFHRQQKILVPDLDSYNDGLDFSKTRAFDEQNNYKTRNLAAFPLFGHGAEPIGVLQIVNADDKIFSDEIQPFIDALSAQVSILLNNALLVSEARNLLAAIVHMVGVAIDEKSPHTAGHCERVTLLTMMLAEEMAKDKATYADFKLGAEERRELRMAAMLHDIGKIITPAHIMEKPTKLFTLYDRINLLRERLRAWWLSEELKRLKPPEAVQRAVSPQGDLQTDAASPATAPAEVASANGNLQAAYEGDFEFLNAINQGRMFVDAAAEKRLDEIARRTIDGDGVADVLIQNEEMRDLRVSRGTLNDDERKIMQEHVSASIRMLSSIPWPKNLERVVEYAGHHHESMNGKGYPHGLTGEQMPLPSRILGLADRFEAISAPDRPYRKVKMSLSKVMHIMQTMSDENEIDPIMFNFFKERKLYLKYARQFLPEELIDCE